MDEEKFVIRFEGLSAAEMGDKAALLLETLRSTAPGVQADLMRTNTEAQDMGATVVLLLSAPAVIAIAKGIANFMVRERPGNLCIETADGRVVFSGDSSDAAKIAAAFAQGKPSR
jgi:hypothetical protein